MRRTAIAFNLASLAFTLFVIATDRPATKPAYVAFSLLLAGVPAVTVFVLARDRGATPARLAALLNAVLIAAVALALVDQAAHPAEPGFVPYVILMFLAPILGLVALLHRGAGHGPPTALGHAGPARAPLLRGRPGRAVSRDPARASSSPRTGGRTAAGPTPSVSSSGPERVSTRAVPPFHPTGNTSSSDAITTSGGRARRS